MTLKIKLSHVKALPFNFDEAVTDYMGALVAHQKTVGEAAPVAPHVLVEHAVRRVQYPVEATHQPMRTVAKEIDGETVAVEEPDGEPIKFMSSEKPDTFVRDVEIEDDTPTLDERKHQLFEVAVAAMHAAMALQFPPMKQRLMQMASGRAMAVLEADRTPEHTDAIALATKYHEANEAAVWHLAQIEATIHDLTAETVDTYVMPPFPS